MSILTELEKTFIQVPSTADSQTQNNWRLMLDGLDSTIDKTNEIIALINSNGLDTYKVKADATDGTPNYLNGKVAKSIVLTSRKLELDGDVLAPGNNYVYGTTGAGIKGWKVDPDDKKVKVSTDDTTPGFLEDKVLGGTGITVATHLGGGNEHLDISTSITQYTDEMAQDAVGAMVSPTIATSSLVYVDATPSLDTIQDIRTTASPTFANIYLGINDTSRGIAHLYGPATGTEFGGTVICYTGADYDTTIQNYGFMVFQDDLYIGPDSNTDALILDSTDNFKITKGYLFVGADDAARGIGYFYGNATGDRYGGTIFCHTSADYDTTVQNYSFMIYDEQLQIGPDTNSDALILDKNYDFWLTAGSIVLPASEYLNFGGTLGTSGYGIFDAAGVMKYKDSGGSWIAFNTFLTSVTAHNILSTTHGDTTVSAPNDNDVLTWSAGTSKWVAAAGGGYTDEQAQDAVGGIFGNSLVYTDGTPLMDTVQDIRTSADPTFVGINFTDGAIYNLEWAVDPWGNGDFDFVVSPGYASHNLCLGKYGTSSFDGALRLKKGGATPIYADLTYVLLDTLQTTGSPAFVGLTLSGMSSAGWVKNTAAGILSGGNAIVQADVGGLTTADGPSFDHIHLTTGASGVSIESGAEYLSLICGATTATVKSTGGRLDVFNNTIGAAQNYELRNKNSGPIVYALSIMGGTNVVKIGAKTLRGTTEGTMHFDIFDGTAPVGTLANGCSIYSESGSLKVMDAAGNMRILVPNGSDIIGNQVFGGE